MALQGTWRRVRNALTLLAACAAVVPAAHAASFGVSPIRLDFDASVKTGAITLTNDEPRRLSFQLKLFRWTQDAAGKDQYEPSNELVFFPQLTTLEPKEKRLVRVGVKTGATDTERTYRLFIEELPDVEKDKGRGAQVAVRLRFGVPLFVAPAQLRRAGAIEGASIAGGQVRFRVRNTGNQHFRFERVSALSVREGVLGREPLGSVEGWYLLPGAARSYTIKLDPDDCAKAGKIELSLTAENLELRRELESSAAACQP